MWPIRKQLYLTQPKLLLFLLRTGKGGHSVPYPVMCENSQVSMSRRSHAAAGRLVSLRWLSDLRWPWRKLTPHESHPGGDCATAVKTERSMPLDSWLYSIPLAWPQRLGMPCRGTPEPRRWAAAGVSHWPSPTESSLDVLLRRFCQLGDRHYRAVLTDG